MHGYEGKIIRVDLSSGRTWTVPTSDYARFVGGRGIAARIHWEEVPPQVKALDPENRLTFITGPLTGFAGFASPRWQVCGKSPATEPEQFCCSNLGGSWGVALKFAGYDGIAVQGKAGSPVYLLVNEDGVELRDAGHLWGKGAIQTRDILKSELGAPVNVVACGQAGENLVMGATLLADQDSAGSGGLGAVMGSKNLKAVAIAKGTQRPVAAHPERLRDLVRYRHWLVGERDVLSYYAQYQPMAAGKMKKYYCWGCPGPCVRLAWKADDGTEGKFFCQSGLVYQTRAQRYYGHGGGDVPFRVTRLCDDYGIDSRTFHVITGWLLRCHRAGILTDEETDIPLSKIGSMEYAASLLRKMAYREGFGDLLAQGLERAADAIGRGAKEQIGDLLMKAQTDEAYGPRIYIVNAMIYATEARMPIQHLHETSIPVEQWLHSVLGLKGAYVTAEVLRKMAGRFYGSEASADYFSYEGKALAAKVVQDREYAKECLILCDLVWPVMTSPNTDDHVGDPSLESQFYSAVTGNETDEAGLYRMGEIVFNLQRAILAREGHRDELPDFVFNSPVRTQTINPDVLVPGPDGRPVSRKGMVLDRAKFEEMKREYYQHRGWDASGKQTRWKMEELGLADVAHELEASGLLV